MKNLLDENGEKLFDFELLYKAMNVSEDYHHKKPIIEKKIRRIG